MKSNQVQAVMTWSEATLYLVERFKWLGPAMKAYVLEDRARNGTVFSLDFFVGKKNYRLVKFVGLWECLDVGLGCVLMEVCKVFENHLRGMGLTPPADA